MRQAEHVRNAARFLDLASTLPHSERTCSAPFPRLTLDGGVTHPVAPQWHSADSNWRERKREGIFADDDGDFEFTSLVSSKLAREGERNTSHEVVCLQRFRDFLLTPEQNAHRSNDGQNGSGLTS